MGLDNGICFRVKDKEAMKEFEDFPFNRYEGFGYCNTEEKEICYLRKFWGVRDDIVGYLNKKYGTSNDTYEWTLDRDDLVSIMNICNKWIGQLVDDEHHCGDASSIWSRTEEVRMLAEMVDDIDRFLNDSWECFDALEVFFYDSY